MRLDFLFVVNTIREVSSAQRIIPNPAQGSSEKGSKELLQQAKFFKSIQKEAKSLDED